MSFLFFLTLPLAADSWKLALFSSSPAEVFDAAHQVPVPAGSDLLLIDVKVTIGIDEQGRETRTRSGVYRVLDEIGAKQFAHFSEPWLPWRQNKPEIRIRVISSDKQAHVLDPSTILEASLPGQNATYGDVKLLQAPLPGIAADSVVEMEVKSGDREAVMPGERFDNFSVRLPYPVHHFLFELEPAPHLQVEARGFASPPTRTAVNGATRFEAWDLPRFQATELLPPESPTGPEIQFTTTRSWQDVARWYASATEPVIGIGNPIGEGTEIDTKLVEEKLAAIQKNVRYTALELGMAAFIPRTPAQTLERRYGDCKDKAVLLIHELRSAGIPARLALLTPYLFPDVNAAMPGLEAFNHVIVYVPGAHPLWIDPTVQYSSAMRVPAADQGRSALIVDANRTSLVKTPDSGADGNVTTDVLTIHLKPHGKADREGRETYVGGTEDGLRGTFATLETSADFKTRMEAQVEKTLRSEKLTHIESSPPSGVGDPFVITYAASGWDGGTTDHGKARATVALDSRSIGPLLIMARASKPRDDEKKGLAPRRDDFYLQSLMSFEGRFEVVPPPGFVISRVPEMKPIDFGVLQVEATSSVGIDNKVEVVYRYKIPKHRYTIAEAADLSKKLEEWQRIPQPTVLFVDSVEKLLSDGKEKDALRLARDRVAAAPTDAASQLQLANTLSTLGLNEEAIRAARHATELDPKSAEGFATLADLNARNEMGRSLKTGMHLERAIEAQKKAVELAPDDKRMALDLARYYEYNDDGERYGAGAHLKEAIAVLQNLEADLPKLNAREQLPAALFFNRQYAEVRDYYEAGHGGTLPLAYDLAALAILDGIEKAKAAFERSSANGSRYAALLNAGLAAARLNEYAAASALFREADRERGDSESLQALADMLANTHPAAAAKLSSDGAVAAVQRLIPTMLQYREDADWRKMMVPEWRDLQFRAERTELYSSLKAFQRVAGQNLPLGVIADIAVSNAALTSEGSDQGGYRVRFADPNKGGSSKTIAWVVKRNGEYLVAGLNNDVAIAGSEALKAAQGGDLQSATLWLDWLREDMTAPTSLDPLAGMVFLKLWPVENPTREDIVLAAASLASRGKHYETALATLHEIYRTASASKKATTAWALMQAGTIHGLVPEIVDVGKELTKAYPGSDIAIADYAAGLSASGDAGAAASFVHARLATNPQSVVILRAQGRLFGERKEYEAAVKAFRQAVRAPKSTAQDWNEVAWAGLFTVPPQTDAVESASTAVHLTQERQAGTIHTLACAQAIAGDTASARKQLYRYSDLEATDKADDASRLLFGLIAEQLGFWNVAKQQFDRIEQPKLHSALSDYQLAQEREALHGSER